MGIYIIKASNAFSVAIENMYIHTAGPATACHHARPAGETQAVQRDGPSPPQTHHEGEGAQETR